MKVEFSFGRTVTKVKGSPSMATFSIFSLSYVN